MNSIGETPAPQQIFRFQKRIAVAEGLFAVLEITQEYLRAWPKERVANLQRIDGGWAPFDSDQNPLPMSTVGRLELFQEAVHRQRLALSRSNPKLTPEIAELDEMLTIANRFAKAISASEFKGCPFKISKRAAVFNLL